MLASREDWSCKLWSNAYKHLFFFRSLLKICAKVIYQKVNIHVLTNLLRWLKKLPPKVLRVQLVRQVNLLVAQNQWDQDERQIGHDPVSLTMDMEGLSISLEFFFYFPLISSCSIWTNYCINEMVMCTMPVSNNRRDKY